MSVNHRVEADSGPRHEARTDRSTPQDLLHHVVPIGSEVEGAPGGEVAGHEPDEASVGGAVPGEDALDHSQPIDCTRRRVGPGFSHAHKLTESRRPTRRFVSGFRDLPG